MVEVIALLKIAIVDDENSVITELNTIVKDFFHEHGKEIDISCYASGEKLLSYHQHFDLILLDIQMQGIDGIDTALEIRKTDKKAVLFYVTSYGNQMARSFSVHPFAFIEKPINRILLHKNLSEFMQYVYQEHEFQGIPFKTTTGTALIEPDDIIYFEYEGNRKIRLVCDSMELYIIDSIKNIFAKVEKYGFLKPHQSFIINPAKIKAVLDLDLDLLMSNKYKVPIALKKKKIMTKQIQRYLCQTFERDF